MTFWRVHPKKMTDSDLKREWTSELWVGDGKVHKGLSVTRSYGDLLAYFAGDSDVGRSAYMKGAHIVQLKGEVIGRGHDGEPLIQPTRVVSSKPVERTSFIQDLEDVLNARRGGSSTDVTLYDPKADRWVKLELDDPSFWEDAEDNWKSARDQFQRGLELISARSSARPLKKEIAEFAEEIEAKWLPKALHRMASMTSSCRRVDSKMSSAIARIHMAAMKVTYSAVFMDDKSVRDLKNWWESSVDDPLHGREFMHHMTIAFKPSWEDTVALPIGKKVQLRVVGYASDAKGQAVLVDSPIESNNRFPHITMATAGGTSPVYSNDLLAKGVTKVKGPLLTGRVGFSDGRKEHFEI